MNQPRTFDVIAVDALHERVRALKEQGFRLVQISATQLPDQVELTYSFDRDSRLTNLRLSLPNGAHLSSISGVFGCAVLYENEVHDLFGVPVDGLAIDFKGSFYKTAVKFPFGSTKAPCAAPAAGTPTPCAVEEAKK
jgi:ech hydrogenase subunit D